MGEFVDAIPTNNKLVNKYLLNKKKFHQKDYPEEWSKLFFPTVGEEVNVLLSVQ